MNSHMPELPLEMRRDDSKVCPDTEHVDDASGIVVAHALKAPASSRSLERQLSGSGVGPGVAAEGLLFGGAALRSTLPPTIQAAAPATTTKAARKTSVRARDCLPVRMVWVPEPTIRPRRASRAASAYSGAAPR